MAEKQEKENRKKEKRRKWNYKKIAIALLVIVILLALVLAFFVFDFGQKIWHKLQGEGTTFVYHNMTFKKTFLGNLALYETNLAIYRPIQNNTLYWTLKIRNDPRKLDKIPANVTSKLTRKIYISFAKEPLQCQGIMLTSYRLGEFADALGAYKEAAVSNEEFAKELAKESNESYPVKNCDDAKNGWSVILLKQSNTNFSYIHQQGTCYILEIANCEHIPVSERFFLALIDTMSPESPTGPGSSAQETATDDNEITNES